MCDSPEGKKSGSPVSFPNIRCNLDSRFQEVKESLRTDSLSVFARVRPLLPHEEAKGYQVCVAAIDEQTVRVVVPTSSAKYKSSRQTEEIIEDYTFTAAFGPETGQFVFFQETMLNIMSNFVEGSNSLVFSYGITGSGKTYTLQGNSEHPGIIPLSLKLLFAVHEKQLMKNVLVKPNMYSEVILLSESEKKKELNIRKHILSLYDDECETAPGSFRNNNEKSFAMTLCNLFSDDYEAEERQTTLNAEDMASAQAATLLKEVIKSCVEKQPGGCSIWISFIEIYNEIIYDLLQPVSNHRPKLNLGEDKNGNVYIKGATEVCIFNSDEALKILNIGRKHLSIASTKMNYQSSRSHCIYSIRVVRVPDLNNITQAVVSRLSFCDLAGSERTSKTQASGVRLKEANSINTSLLVLGRCLEHLRLSQMGRDKRLIPFRESKLTRIFSGFFLGQGRAAMIANASPSDYTFDETLHVLKFSAVARKILMNDTFLSNASSTIHSICNKWEMYKTNISTCNESMESIDSDSELIQEKDELIEKLLSLAENFAKKEKEMNNMEMHIRREVCQEYAEVREELMAMQKLRYEEEIASLTAAYEKRIANMQKIHDNVIQGFKDQLSDSVTDESLLNDQSLDSSNSSEVLNNSGRLSLSKSALPKKEVDEYTVELDSAKKELEKLQSDLNDLKQTNEELTVKIIDLESQNSAHSKRELEEKNAELQLAKTELEKMQSELIGLKRMNEELSLKIVDFESIKENLRKDLSSEIQNLSQLKKELDEKNAELYLGKNELEKMQSKLDDLKQINEELTLKIVDFESVKETLKKDLSSESQNSAHSKRDLEEKNAELELAKTELEKMQSELIGLKRMNEELSLKIVDFESVQENLREDLSSEVQKSKKFLDKINCLEEEIAVLKATKLTHEKEIQNLKEKISESHLEVGKSEKIIHDQCETISTLENEAEILHKEIESLEKKLAEFKESKEVCEMEFEKERSRLKKEILEAKSAVKEYKNIQILYQSDLEKKNEKIASLEQELKLRESVSMELKKEIEKMQKEIQELMSSKLDMEIKVSTSRDEFKHNQEYSQQLSSKIKELESKNTAYESEIQKLLKNKENLNDSSRVITLEKELSCVQTEIITLKEANKLISDNLLHLEDKNKKYDMDIKQLKEDELVSNSQKKELQEKLTVASDNIKSMKQDIHEKAAKISELENQLNAYKSEVSNLKDECERLESENMELRSEIGSCKERIREAEENLASAVKNADTAREANKQLTEFEKGQYKQEIKNLKAILQQAEEEKNDVVTTMSEKVKRIADIQAELCTVKDLLNTANSDLEKKDLQLKNLKNDLALSNVQLQEKIAQINANKESLEKYELEIKSIKKEVEKLRNNYDAIASEKDELQKSLGSERLNLDQLKTEMKEKVSELESVTKKLRKNESDLSALVAKSDKLNHKIKDLESEKKKLEKTIAENESNSQEMLKKSKTSFEEKMLLEKEQHTVEIEQTMQLKREVENENGKLKEENIKFKENIKLLEEKLESLEQVTAKPVSARITPKETLSKDVKKIETKETGTKPKIIKAASKAEIKETKESPPRKVSTRTLRHKEIKIQDLSFSSKDSNERESIESGALKKNRKRISDEDFDPSKEPASKKMKSSEEPSKIPVKRAPRKKLLREQTETLSPVQKIANSISTRFKSVAESVSSKLASPRVTRGRKKLYNPDSGATSKSEKVTRGKK